MVGLNIYDTYHFTLTHALTLVIYYYIIHDDVRDIIHIDMDCPEQEQHVG